MTSFAFITGSIPLAIASGAGAHARVSMGTVVIGGLVVATFITLFITPTFYVAFERLLGSPRPARDEPSRDGGRVQPAE